MKVGVVRNPNANKNRKNKNPKEALIEILDVRGFLIETRDTNKSLEDAIASFLNEDVDVICTDGGDGTVHHTLTKLIELYEKDGKEIPIFVPLMSGTVNFAAKCIGSNKKPVEILEDIMEREIETKTINTLKIAYKEKNLCGFVYGMGMIANFLEKYYDKNTSGFLSYETSVRKASGLIFKSIVSLTFGTSLSKEIIKPIFADIKTDNYRESNPMVVLASTLQINVLGLKPFHELSKSGEGIYVVSGNFEKSTLLKNIPNVFLGKKLSGEGIYMNKINCLEIKTNEECSFTIDGELYKLNIGESIIVEQGPKIRVPIFK